MSFRLVTMLHGSGKTRLVVSEFLKRETKSILFVATKERRADIIKRYRVHPDRIVALDGKTDVHAAVKLTGARFGYIDDIDQILLRLLRVHVELVTSTRVAPHCVTHPNELEPCRRCKKSLGLQDHQSLDPGLSRCGSVLSVDEDTGRPKRSDIKVGKNSKKNEQYLAARDEARGRLPETDEEEKARHAQEASETEGEFGTDHGDSDDEGGD